ncbi:NINE protein [Nocardia sp. 348MFTsu5.1]|uniref:NINE protein n=1 Tax=Nocardia sp. 348MFTsu5.1 TaxID=1172185 RepID=UPI000D774C94|nr:NINE protein [Nocardia sp. 348MFTsu5.1]
MTQPPPGFPPQPPQPMGGPQNDTFYVSLFGQEQGPMGYQDLAGLTRSGQVKPETQVRTQSSSWFPVSQVPGLFSSKEWLTTLLLSVIVGGFGIDRFYLGYTGLGIAKLLTCGGLGVWTIIDIVLVAMRKVTDSDGLPLK